MNPLVVAAFLILSPVKTEHGRFTILKDGKKIGTEEFTIAMRESTYTVDGKLTMGQSTLSSRMELDQRLVPVSYEVANQEGRIRVLVSTPLSELQSFVGGETSSADFRFPEGGIILDNNFFHHYLILLYRAQMGQSDFSVFVPQDRSLGSAVVRSAGTNMYELHIGDIQMQAATDAEGRLIRLTVPSANVVVER
jgi:hypothetical protein